jgi:crossover junction endonuclease MUS81
MIYLVEENEMNDAAAGIGQESIRTSFSTTQLFDQFTLRRSKNAEESMDYIADLTRFIERKHTKIDLHAIPTNAVSDTYGKMRAEWEAKNPGRKIMTTFEAFNCDFNSKNDNFTRRDVFTRQLMTVRGMGQEKAAAVAEMYPTLMHLKRAYVKCGDGEKMLHRVSEDWGVRRAVGVGLSKKVWALFCEKDMYN